MLEPGCNIMAEDQDLSKNLEQVVFYSIGGHRFRFRGLSGVIWIDQNSNLYNTGLHVNYICMMKHGDIQLNVLNYNLTLKLYNLTLSCISPCTQGVLYDLSRLDVGLMIR